MPPTKEFITKTACKDCRDISRRSTRLITGMMGLFLILLGWSLWCSYEANASAAVIQGQQSVQAEAVGWIKKSLTRIEDRLDSLILP